MYHDDGGGDVTGGDGVCRVCVTEGVHPGTRGTPPLVYLGLAGFGRHILHPEVPYTINNLAAITSKLLPGRTLGTSLGI